ncbi:ParB/RepB/Spo0J family partition protein (plasmid) [Burkholderia vietnamiensis]|uniref:ParB, partition protein n=1 Tax=Burkholderia vietnamiensis (strain G4 / LMG 22486) TaxID=269482 RepID=A4JVE8_BURVG|nr:ParB, partition protein [Burkholderia vietnamiensis G4]MCB4349439.1 ParB/RepB/Spo0J family partition protein [Burkholderia vietnamiensis]
MTKKGSLLDRTAQLEVGDRPERPAGGARGPLSAPGRMFDLTQRINDAEDRATAAVAEAETAKQQLEEARRTIEALERNGSAAGAMEIDISTLVEVPGRRRVLSPAEYNELRDNLAKNPLVHPIVYRSLGNGKNEIISGGNRVAIYRDDLGRTKILGVPFTGDAKAAEMGATFANLLAPSLPDFEKFRQFERLQHESGFTRSDIIEASGLTKQHVARILSFEKLPQAARDAISKRPDRVGGHAAEDFAQLAANGNAEAVVKAIEALVADESLTQKRALELAKPKAAPKTPQVAARTISIGRKKFCDVSVRSGTVGLRFAGKGADADANAQTWADKIEAFIRRELEAQGGE